MRKKMVFSLVTLLISLNTLAQSAPAEVQQQPLRPVQNDSIDMNTPEGRFQQFYKLRSTKFHGRAQGLSMFNLDLEMVIHYNEPLLVGRPYTFSFATNGNLHIAGVPVFPINGQVKFEVADMINSRGQVVPYLIDGEPVQLSRQAETFYMVESDAALAQRQERISILNAKGDTRFEKAKGRMIAVVKFYLNLQKVSFFQVDASSGELIPSGVFEGKVR